LTLKNASERAGVSGPSARSPALIASIVACAFFMEMLDSTVIVTALPKMAVSFGANPVDLSLGLTAYILTLAVVVPASGWIADRFGSRNVFCAAIGVFTIASVLCGLSNSLAEFVAARILQGIGGALMSPVGRLAVLRSTEKSDLVRIMNFVTVPGLIGPVIGPPLGGFITTYASWRYIFLLNVPIGIVGMVLVALYIRNHRGDERRPFDLLGFILNSTALVALIHGVQMIGSSESGWRLGSVVTALGLGPCVLAIRHAKRHAHPLVDVKPLRIKSFAVTNLGGSLFRISIAAPTFLMPLFFQVGLGMSAFKSGMLILAHAAGDLGIKVATTQVIRRFGFRAVMIWSVLFYAVFIIACAAFTDTTPLSVIVVVLFLSGAFRSLQMTSQMAVQFADVPAAEMTSASTLSAVLQQVVRGIGVAFAAVLLNFAGLLLHGDVSAVTETDFRIAFVIIALVGAASAVSYRKLDRETGALVSGHRRVGPAKAAGTAD
jgi:EmrB/QacA subfamily drug resistance transporter